MRLLDDPANDTRPYDVLSAEANTFQLEQYIRPRLSPAALKTYPLDNATDPGFLRCEPWGLVRNVVARHQLEIRRQGNDRLEMRYGEDETGKVVNWTVEFDGVLNLTEGGWTERSIVAGQRLTVSGNPTHTNSARMFFRRLRARRRHRGHAPPGHAGDDD